MGWCTRGLCKGTGKKAIEYVLLMRVLPVPRYTKWHHRVHRETKVCLGGHSAPLVTFPTMDKIPRSAIF